MSNSIRKKQYHKEVHTKILEQLKDEMENPDYYRVNELAELIEKAISELPEKYKETFLLSRLGDMTNE